MTVPGGTGSVVAMQVSSQQPVVRQIQSPSELHEPLTPPAPPVPASPFPPPPELPPLPPAPAPPPVWPPVPAPPLWPPCAATPAWPPWPPPVPGPLLSSVAASPTDGTVHWSSVNVPCPTVQTGSLGHCQRRLIDPSIVAVAQAQSQAGAMAHRPSLVLQDRQAVGPVQYEPATEHGGNPTGADVQAPPSAVERAFEPHPLPSPRARPTTTRGRRRRMARDSAISGPRRKRRLVAVAVSRSLRNLMAAYRTTNRSVLLARPSPPRPERRVNENPGGSNGRGWRD
jgi:hypothetical protein